MVIVNSYQRIECHVAIIIIKTNNKFDICKHTVLSAQPV